MLIQSYLSLHTSCLKLSEKWACEGEELFLVFPKTGVWQITSCAGCVPVTGGGGIVLSGRARWNISAIGETEQNFSWFSISLDRLYPLFSTGEIAFLQNIPQALRSPKVYPGASPI